MTKYWLCAILKENSQAVPLEYCTQPIFCGIDAITDNHQVPSFEIQADIFMSLKSI